MYNLLIKTYLSHWLYVRLQFQNIKEAENSQQKKTEFNHICSLLKQNT